MESLTCCDTSPPKGVLEICISFSLESMSLFCLNQALETVSIRTRYEEAVQREAERDYWIHATMSCHTDLFGDDETGS